MLPSSFVPGLLAEASFPEHGQQWPGGVEDGRHVRRIQLPSRFQQQGRPLPQPNPPQGRNLQALIRVADSSGGVG